MDVTELLRVLWQRKLIVVAVTVVAVALGFGALAVQTKVYQATATIALTPSGTAQDPIFIISQIDVITPLYAEAVKTHETTDDAQRRMGRRPLGDVAVRTFRGAPIIKIDVRSPDPALAQQGAQAVTDALLARVTSGVVGIPSTLAVNEIDRPTLPTDPVKPQPKLTILVALILGLGAGVGAALLWDRLGRKVETAEEVSSTAGVACFGEIPTDRAVADLASPLALVSEPRYRIVAEVLRDIRTNLQFTKGDLRSVLVTSPEGRHGKTFTSLGLAATFARAGARTLLVDGDLRRGRVAEMLSLPRHPGLHDVLNGAPLTSAVRATDLASLWVLPGGKLQDDPVEALEASFFQLLYDLEAAYDVVVVDATPLMPVNDARLMARYTSATIMVVSSGTLTRRQVRAALDRLTIIDVALTAVVVNKSKVRRRASYYRYLDPADHSAAS